MVIQTDTAAESNKVRIGALILVPGRKPAVLVYDRPAQIRAMWGERATIINQAELHAAPLVVASAPQLLRRRHILWLLDNTSAETALVNAGSPIQTMCKLSLVACAALAGIGDVTWLDHVASADNPADVLSRHGYEDARVARKAQT